MLRRGASRASHRTLPPLMGFLGWNSLVSSVLTLQTKKGIAKNINAKVPLSIFF